jgi:TPR repeat protein
MSGKLQCKCLLKLGYATWSKAPVKWLQNAAVQGHIRSKLLLIDVTRGPVQDVISNLAEAVLLGNGSAYFAAAEIIGWRRKFADTSFCPDAVKAVQWLQVASGRGNANATFYLGVCHYVGYGVPVDRPVGQEYLRGAEKRYPRSLYYIIKLCVCQAHFSVDVLVETLEVHVVDI